MALKGSDMSGAKSASTTDYQIGLTVEDTGAQSAFQESVAGVARAFRDKQRSRTIEQSKGTSTQASKLNNG